MNVTDKEKVKQFVSIIDKIKNSRFTKETKNISYHLNFEEGQPLQQTVGGFDEEDLRSMLLDLRKITLKRDDVFILDICNILIANTTDQGMIALFEKSKSNYQILIEQPAIKIVIDNEIETGWDVIRKWLYGEYFHEKQEKNNLQKLGVAEQIHKFSFVSAITDFIKICVVVANNAKVVLTK